MNIILNTLHKYLMSFHINTQKLSLNKVARVKLTHGLPSLKLNVTACLSMFFFFYKFLFRLDKNIQFQQTNVRFPETSLLGVNSFASLTLSEFVCM